MNRKWRRGEGCRGDAGGRVARGGEEVTGGDFFFQNGIMLSHVSYTRSHSVD